VAAAVIVVVIVRITVVITVVIVVGPVSEAEADGCGGNRESAMPESGMEAAAETVDGKAAAAKSGRRKRRRTETATADRRGTKTPAAHSNPAAMETTATVKSTVAKAAAGQGCVRHQHGD